MSYTLLGSDGRSYESDKKGQWGGHRGARIYGRLDCPSALGCGGMADMTGQAWAVDASVPNIARMYDYWLGGKDNLEVLDLEVLDCFSPDP